MERQDRATGAAKGIRNPATGKRTDPVSSGYLSECQVELLQQERQDLNCRGQQQQEGIERVAVDEAVSFAVEVGVHG